MRWIMIIIIINIIIIISLILKKCLQLHEHLWSIE